MILVHVDFFSSGKVSGWTNAKAIGANSIIIKTDCGLSKDITELITVIRHDVNGKYDLDTNAVTGFTINLFDLFNDRVRGFYIYIDGFKAWSSSSELIKLENTTNLSSKRYFELGSKRVFIIYDVGSWLDEISGKLHVWNKNQFNKKMNNGVAISFLSIEEYRANVKSIDLSKAESIFIIERSVVRSAIILNEKIAVSPILILEKNIDLNLDFHGILSSIFFINALNDGIEITATLLRELIDTITSYSEMFFTSENGLILHVYGSATEEMMNTIRDINQEVKPFEGCILLSKEKIVKMSSFTKNDSAIFMNSKLLKNTFDIINLEPEQFLDACFKRGIKVKNLSVGS